MVGSHAIICRSTQHGKETLEIRFEGDVGALIQGVQAEVLYTGAISGIITAVQELKVRVPPTTGAGIQRFQIVLETIPSDIGNIWMQGK